MKLWEKEIPFYDAEVDFIPGMEVYPANSKGAVVVFPGGAYAMKAPHEGEVIAKWFNSIGITAWVVDYRVAPYKHPAEISDAARAVRVARANAEKYGYDKDKIAVMGFSAGGHLAGSISVHYDDVFHAPTDEIDKESARPDASILCYPVIDMFEYRHDGSRTNLLGNRSTEAQKEYMALHLNITEDTPPAFLWHTSADQAVPVENTLLYAEGLSSCMVPFEIHIYPYGNHGLGLAPDDKHVAQWASALENWLVLMGWK